MNDFLDLFISYLAVEKGLSTNTQEAYSRDLARYPERNTVGELYIDRGYIGSSLVVETLARRIWDYHHVHHDLAEADAIPGGSKANLEWVRPHVRFPESMSPAERIVLADAQTNGGLLAAVHAERADEILAVLARAGVEAARIGEVGELWSGMDDRRRSLREATAKLRTMLTDADWSEALAASTRRPVSRKAPRKQTRESTRSTPSKTRRGPALVLLYLNA